MALPTPNLDDRKFQDIVSEARRKIPLYCPKWTDYNLSDPGITLIELFAWMTDIMLFRMNKVPDKNYIKFMELIGVHLQPPKPASVDLTFRLSAAQNDTVTIPKGTQAGTVRTEMQEAVTFSTDRDMVIRVPKISHAFTTIDDNEFKDVFQTLKNPDMEFSIFEDKPQETNAMYVGYETDLKGHTLALALQSNIEGIGVDPHNPPLQWEYWHGELGKWYAVNMESDSTGGLNTNGQVVMRIPAASQMREINGMYAFWIRCRATKPKTNQRAYTTSPKIKSLNTTSIGGTVPARQSLRISGEVVGRSDGKNNQKFYLNYLPVLPREEGEYLEVETDTSGVYEPWEEVDDFSLCDAQDKCYTLDSVSGEIQFGPTIRDSMGSEKTYGITPGKDRLLRFTHYRCGGGVNGNVGERTIIVPKSSIPYVASVTNFEAAKGGTDTETLDHAKMRVPEMLKSRTRAVTADDFEYFALQASPRIARARCLAAGNIGDGQPVPAGTVRLLVVPKVDEDIEGPIPPDDLELTPKLKEDIQVYLDERRLLGTTLVISTPEYQPVDVEVDVKIKQGYDLHLVQTEIEKRLYKYINPVYGGHDGNGFPFGRSLSMTDVYTTIQSVTGIEYIDEIKLYPVDPKTAERMESTTKVPVKPNMLICSHKHVIKKEYHTIN